MSEYQIDKQQVCDITLRWARHSSRMFPRWELAELHNESFLVAMHLLQADRYKPEKGALSTFLWHALSMDVRHRYRNANGERYLTDKDGKRRYRKTEIVSDLVVRHEQIERSMIILEPKLSTSTVNQDWLEARIAGMGASELRRRGMSYKEQRQEADKLNEENYGKTIYHHPHPMRAEKLFYDKQQSKRQTR